MSSASSFQATLDTFSPPVIETFSARVAPRPRVVAVYATSIPRRSKCSLSMHQTLRMKPTFHPYSRSDRPPCTGIQITPHSPRDSFVEPSNMASPPDSPLSELDDSISSLPGVRVILTPPPKGKLTVNTVGWVDDLKPPYRVSSLCYRCFSLSAKVDKKCAREAVDLYLNLQRNLKEQTADALDKARTHVGFFFEFVMLHLLNVPPDRK